MNITEIKSDFQSGPDNQIIDLSDKARYKDFWNWFQKKAVDLEICDKPKKELVNDSNIAGRCYGNSQVITVNENIDYYEGFVKNKGSFLMHGFNVVDGKVQDYTALSNPKDFKDWNGKLASDYCGVKIDKAFIEKHNSEDIKENYINIPPLLEKLFIEETSK
jgi:hypothetical protein